MQALRKTVLIVDRDPIVQSTLGSILSVIGIESVFANCAAESIEKMRLKPDAVIVDPDMSDKTDVALLREFRALSELPILIHSRCYDETFRITSLENGADGILPKPCNPRELVARLRRLLHANEYAKDEYRSNFHINTHRFFRVGHWIFDRVLHELIDNNGKKIALGVTEFAILNALVNQPQSILSRESLSDSLKRTLDQKSRVIDVAISKLRRALGTQKDGSPFIRSLRSQGYVFIAPVSTLGKAANH